MNGQAQAPAPPEVSSLRMIATLGGVALLSGVLVVLAFQFTAPYIAANKRAVIEAALSHVIPGAVTRRIYTLSGAELVPGEAATGMTLYGGYDRAGRLVGIAAEAAAPGYQDVIQILYGYGPGCRCITGMHVLQSKETPGLGDRIAKDPAFRANFEALDARLNQEGTALANPIVTVKHGRKRNPWEIDAISGATVSSRAIGRMLNDSAGHLLPRLLPLLQRIERLEPERGDEAP